MASYGVVAQSIGGGGGNGGDSTAAAYALEGAKPIAENRDFALGGSGGSGGPARGNVTVANRSSLPPARAVPGRSILMARMPRAILAQSIGGGGGTGAAGNASDSSPNFGDDTGTSVDLTEAALAVPAAIGRQWRRGRCQQ